MMMTHLSYSAIPPDSRPNRRSHRRCHRCHRHYLDLGTGPMGFVDFRYLGKTKLNSYNEKKHISSTKREGLSINFPRHNK